MPSLLLRGPKKTLRFTYLGSKKYICDIKLFSNKIIEMLFFTEKSKENRISGISHADVAFFDFFLNFLKSLLAMCYVACSYLSA